MEKAEAPTEEGFYWVRFHGGAQWSVVRFWLQDGRRMAMKAWDWGLPCLVEDFGGSFLEIGPAIPLPGDSAARSSAPEPPPGTVPVRVAGGCLHIWDSRHEPFIPRFGVTFIVDRCRRCGAERCGDSPWPFPETRWEIGTIGAVPEEREEREVQATAEREESDAR